MTKDIDTCFLETVKLIREYGAWILIHDENGNLIQETKINNVDIEKKIDF